MQQCLSDRDAERTNNSPNSISWVPLPPRPQWNSSRLFVSAIGLALDGAIRVLGTVSIALLHMTPHNLFNTPFRLLGLDSRRIEFPFIHLTSLDPQYVE